jgi:hypothetical protein
MVTKGLKDITFTAKAEATRASPLSPRLMADELRRLAEDADPRQPPAVMPPPGGSTLLTMRVQIALADAIADAAEAQGTTQKVIITRALAAAGFKVAQVDLEDRTPRRRPRGRAAA